MIRRLALAWQPRSDPKSRQPGLASSGVHQNISGLDVLMDQAAVMQVSNRGHKVDSQTQRRPQVRWLAEQFTKGHTTGILQHKHGTVPVEGELNRSGSPCRIELLS